MSVPFQVRPVRLRVMLAAGVITLAAAGGGLAQVPDPAPGPRAPISLTELLARVQQSHPRFAGARSRVDVARGSRRAAGVLPNPVLGLAVENAALPGGDPAPGMDREVMTTAMLPLEYVYQRGPRVSRATAELQAAEADAAAERQRLALEAAQAYYQAALAQIELATAADLAAWLDSLVAYHERRAVEGLSAEAELLRVRLERERAWSDVALRQAELVQVRAALAAFAGDSGGSGIGLTVQTPDRPLRPMDPPGPAEPEPGGWEARPEVRAARARFAASDAAVGLARAMIIPEFGAMVGLKRSAGTSTLMAGLTVPFPLLNQHGGERARVRAERDVAGYELSATERLARADLAGSSEAAHLLADRVERLAGPAAVAPGETGPPMTYLERADETRRITLEAHREGAVPLVQVLDAARAWGEARMSYYRILYAQHESVLRRLLAEGRDLFSAMARMPSEGGR